MRLKYPIRYQHLQVAKYADDGTVEHVLKRVMVDEIPTVISVEGQQFKLSKDGFVEVPNALGPTLLKHGYTPAPADPVPAKDDGKGQKTDPPK